VIREQGEELGMERAEVRGQKSEDKGQRAEDRDQRSDEKKAHAKPFKDRFLKYNENIFFDGLRWYDFHRGWAS
jgi:hypothetical protein